MGRKLVLLVVGMFFAISLMGAQNSFKISTIRENAGRYLNEVVTLEGFVTQYVEEKQTTSFYFLKDDWGGIIKVRTSQGKPQVGRRHRVTGPISVEAQGEPYISEEKRQMLEKPITVDAPTGKSGSVDSGKPVDVQSPPRQDKLIYYVVGIAIVLIALIGLLVYVVKRGRNADRGDESVADELSVPSETLEGKTIKMQVPPPGTLKLLPGRFEVVSGDDTVKEVRFYKPKGRTSTEVTFGRSKGSNYTHVQLKPLTVSSRQAKVIFENGKAQLVNYPGPDSNPTRLNGREMSMEESILLQPDDLISMGEIEFRYKPS